MAEVSWIKLSTNIFSNRKVALLLNERDGDTYFRIWIQLLTIAGQCNSNGKLIIGENSPLNVQQLSKILGKSAKKVGEILNKFIDLKMIKQEIYSLKWKEFLKKENQELYFYKM